VVLGDARGVRLRDSGDVLGVERRHLLGVHRVLGVAGDDAAVAAGDFHRRGAGDDILCLVDERVQRVDDGREHEPLVRLLGPLVFDPRFERALVFGEHEVFEGLMRRQQDGRGRVFVVLAHF
jgi:hypothetical protein